MKTEQASADWIVVEVVGASCAGAFVCESIDEGIFIVLPSAIVLPLKYTARSIGTNAENNTKSNAGKTDGKTSEKEKKFHFSFNRSDPIPLN